MEKGVCLCSSFHEIYQNWNGPPRYGDKLFAVASNLFSFLLPIASAHTKKHIQLVPSLWICLASPLYMGRLIISSFSLTNWRILCACEEKNQAKEAKQNNRGKNFYLACARGERNTVSATIKAFGSLQLWATKRQWKLSIVIVSCRHEIHGDALSMARWLCCSPSSTVFLFPLFVGVLPVSIQLHGTSHWCHSHMAYAVICVNFIFLLFKIAGGCGHTHKHCSSFKYFFDSFSILTDGTFPTTFFFLSFDANISVAAPFPRKSNSVIWCVCLCVWGNWKATVAARPETERKSLALFAKTPVSLKPLAFPLCLWYDAWSLRQK